jgi:hypothetical protein
MQPNAPDIEFVPACHKIVPSGSTFFLQLCFASRSSCRGDLGAFFESTPARGVSFGCSAVLVQ